MGKKNQLFKYILYFFVILFVSCTPDKEKKVSRPTPSLPVMVEPEPTGKEHPCTALNKGLTIKEGCVGETCSIILKDGLSLLESVTLYEGPGTDTKIVGELKKCEAYFDVKQYLLFSKVNPALVVTVQDDLKKVGINPGDKVYLSHYGGEGSWFLCLGDKIVKDWGDTGAIAVEIYQPNLNGLGLSLVIPDENVTFVNPEGWYSLVTSEGKKVYTNNLSFSFNDKHRDPIEIKKACPNAKYPDSLIEAINSQNR